MQAIKEIICLTIYNFDSVPQAENVLKESIKKSRLTLLEDISNYLPGKCLLSGIVPPSRPGTKPLWLLRA